jgi:hypothetical protein
VRYVCDEKSISDEPSQDFIGRRVEAGAAYARMMSGNAQFRVVLTT